MSEVAATAESAQTVSNGTEIIDLAPGVSSSSPGVPVQTPKPEKYHERLARAVARMSGKEPPAPVAPPDAPAKLEGAKPEPATEEPAAEAPAPAAPAVDAKAEARLSRALADVQKHEARALKAEQASKTAEEARQKLESEFSKLSARLDALTKNPLEALKASGLSPDEFNRKVINGEIKAPTETDFLKQQFEEQLAAHKAEVEALKAEREAEKKAAAERDEQTKAEQTRARDLDIVKSTLKAAEKDYPIASAVANPEEVLKLCYEHGISDPNKVLEHMENTGRQQIETLLSSRQTAELLLKSPKIRETVKAILGGADQSRKTANSSDGPRALAADVVSAPTTPQDPKKPASKDERMKNALKRLGFAGS